MIKLPDWLIKRTPKSENIRKIRRLIGDKVHTVCEEARCPNIGECYSCGTVTFMILGDICTRNCGFCGVKKGKPSKIDDNEPKNIAEAAKKLGLKYVVITSVTRDDLADGGASHFAATISEVRRQMNGVRIEVLIPDLKGCVRDLETILRAGPDVLNHNVEMVPRLYQSIRPLSNYNISLHLLKISKSLNMDIPTKSGFMLGLGEKEDEILELMEDLKNVRVDFLTIGQYIAPSQYNVKVVKYVLPEIFDHYRNVALKMGFKKVFSGPFVRSSYRAGGY